VHVLSAVHRLKTMNGFNTIGGCIYLLADEDIDCLYDCQFLFIPHISNRFDYIFSSPSNEDSNDSFPSFRDEIEGSRC